MASIEVREKFALIEDELEAAVAALKALPGIEECAILTTCNRSEIYAAVSDAELAMESLHQFYRSFKNVDIREFRGHLFTLLHEDAVRHLFRVASGLDSLILGEGQILGQVRDTLLFAQKHETIGPILDKVFKSALTVGKRVRTETGIADKDVSVSRAAFELAKQMDPDLLQRKIALVGGGKMASILMSSLKRDVKAEDHHQVSIVNRSEQRLQTLVEKYGFQGHAWPHLESVIAEAEVLFVATGAPHLVLGPKHFEHSGPKLVLDISVPRNVDPRVGELPGIRLFNTDDLAGVCGFSAETQAELKAQAQAIINEEFLTFDLWLATRSAIPTITKLRDKIESIRQEEVLKACAEGGQQNASGTMLIDSLSKSLVNKILHDPTVRLKTTLNLDEIYHQAQTLSQLFNLESTTSSRPSPESSDERNAG